MSFYPYVVCWDAVHFNVVEIEENFQKFGQELTIINSGDMKRDHWMNVGDIRYYRQLRMALEDFDMSYDYMAFICGDVSSSNWPDVLRRASEVLNNYNVGVYAPHLTNEPWNKDACYLANVENEHDLFISCETDGILVFINKEIVKLLIGYFNYLEEHTNIVELKSGWGMDVIWCTLSMYLGYPILRDNRYIVNHPAGSSYDHGRASEELRIVIDNFNEYAKVCGFDPDAIGALQSNIYGRMSKDPNLMSLDKFYSMPITIKKEPREINYHIVTIDDSRLENKNNLINHINGNRLDIPVLNAKIPEVLDKFYLDNPDFKLVNWQAKKGEVGCFGSHYLAWKYLVESDLDYLTIFEDDIILHDNFLEIYNQSLNNLPRNWDVFSIFIDANQLDRFDRSHEINYYIAKGYQDWSTLGYVVSKAGAQKMLDFVKNNGISQPVDWFIFRNGREGAFNVYTLPRHIKCPMQIDHRHSSQVQGEEYA